MKISFSNEDETNPSPVKQKLKKLHHQQIHTKGHNKEYTYNFF